jgi:hypothetical protein
VWTHVGGFSRQANFLVTKRTSAVALQVLGNVKVLSRRPLSPTQRALYLAFELLA